MSNEDSAPIINPYRKMEDRVQISFRGIKSEFSGSPGDLDDILAFHKDTHFVGPLGNGELIATVEVMEDGKVQPYRTTLYKDRLVVERGEGPAFSGARATEVIGEWSDPKVNAFFREKAKGRTINGVQY